MKKTTLSLLLLLGSFISHAQLSVSVASEQANADTFIDSLVRHVLADSSLTINSVDFSGNTQAFGYFAEGTNAFGLSNGLLLSTGMAAEANPAIGSTEPNTSFSSPGDPDLTAIIDPSLGTLDAAAITIDFVPHGDTLGLEYFYASADYGSSFICGDFADVIGIFLSGPGISGPFENDAINMAIVPGRQGVPVCINTINEGVGATQPGGDTITIGCDILDPLWRLNAVHYAGPNPAGAFPGYTKLLPTLSVPLISQSTYQLKIVIADTRDGAFDAAAFLKAGSLTSWFPGSPPGPPTSDTISIDSTICQGTTFLLPDGSVYTYDVGVNEDTLNIISGLDTFTLILRLEVLEAPQQLITINSCEGDVVELFGLQFTQNSEFTQTVPAPGTCDSIITYIINFFPRIETYEEVLVCTLAEERIDTTFFISVNGCDSLHIVFYTPDFEQIQGDTTEIRACEGDQVEVGGMIFTDSGSFEMLFTASNGCDSFATYVIFFESSPDTTFIEIPTCRAEDINTTTLNFTTDGGCDSIVVVSTILDTTTVLSELLLFESCPGDTLIIEGQQITTDTSWFDNYTAENGCDSIVETRIQFIDTEFIVLEDIPSQWCQGEPFQLIYGEDFISQYAFDFVEELADTIPLPDGTGAAYATSIMVDNFPEGTTIGDASELEICLTIEHSWMHDLEINLSCPNGATIQLQNQEFIANEVWLGIPFELDDTNPGPTPIPGTGFTYCWTADAPNGTWTNYSLNNDPGSPGQYTLPEGTYAPTASFDGLVGCSWNGEWTLIVTDFWAADNGYIFSWSIGGRNREPDTAVIASQAWLPHPEATISGDTLNFPANQTGDFEFTYTLQDTSGCVSDTTFHLRVFPSYLVEQDITLCPGSTLYGMPVDTPGLYTIVLPTLEGCDSTLQFQLSLLDVDTAFLTSSSCRIEEVGIFTEVLPSSEGCDSLVITEISYDAPADTTIEQYFTCDPGLVDDLIVLPGSDGCDSIILIDFVYQPLLYSIIDRPDTCMQGLGNLEIEILGDPGFENIEILLFPIDDPGQISTGTIFTGLFAGLYQLEIRADDYCELIETVPVINIGGGPPSTPAFTYNAAFTTAFFNADPSSAAPPYLWDFGDGNTATGQVVEHTYDYYGLYEACLSTESDCGPANSCDTLFLPFTVETFGNGADSGESLSLAVRTTGVYQLAELNVLYQFLLPDILSIDSLSPAAFAESGDFNYDIGNDSEFLSISWNTSVDPGLTLEFSDTLFLIHITLNGPPGAYSDIIAAEPPTANFFLNGQRSAQYEVGFTPTEVFINEQGDNISGLVLTAPYHTAALTPIANVTAVMGQNDLSIETDITGPDGQYSFFGQPGEYHRFYFEKEGDGLNGLSTLGILRLLRHLAGSLPFSSPYELIAADVNCSQEVNIDDAVRLQEVVLGNGEPICTSWVFVASTYTFPDPASPFPFQQIYEVAALAPPLNIPPFYGIKVGDVIGEAAPERPVASDSLLLTVNNRIAAPGDAIELSFRADGFDMLTGFQLELQFDTSRLQWIDAETNSSVPDFTLANFGLGKTDDGLCRINWFSTNLLPFTLEDGEVLFTLRFQAKGLIEDGLEPLLALYPAELAPEAYDAAFERLPLLMQFEALNAARSLFEEGPRLYQNQPNPYSQATSIPFFLPQGSEVELLISGPLGRLISQHRQYYPAGLHYYEFRPESELKPGIYTYTLKAQYGWESKRMIFTFW